MNNMDVVMASLNLMWMGMLAIFTVIIIIFVITQIMLRITNRKRVSAETDETR